MTSFTHEGVTFILGDCMEHMARMADGAYSLAVVDPPYGIGDFWQGGDTSAQAKINQMRKTERSWNNATPDINYFQSLKRVGKNQIIWGWNYYTEYLGSSESLVYWYKRMGAPNYSQGEIAWTSFGHKIKHLDLPLAIDNQKRTHPCQKPVALYRWLLQNYARPGQTILDTHLGSGSSAIAAWEMGYTFTGIEIDEDYYHAAVARFKKRIAQPYLPGLVQPAKPRQDVLL